MDTEFVAGYIAGWLQDYLGGTGAAGFVVGVSGGIDSAVVSSLAALTGSTTLCVELPIHQAKAQVDRADEHINGLMARYDNVTSASADLTDAYDTFSRTFTEDVLSGVADWRIDLAGANARSRLRMTALYHFAGLHNLLVLGTGNKIEDFGVGFFTKYGDGGVDLSPIGDLTKTEVFRLGEWLGVPESILAADPTDGLFGDDRTDEQQIGASYTELECAMAYDASGGDPDALSGREREVYEIYTRRNRANRHKMIPVPVCKVPRG